MNAVKDISIEAYDYPLPEERIAKYPLPERDASKLLVAAINREFRGNDELIVFDIELSSRDTLPSRTFVLE